MKIVTDRCDTCQKTNVEGVLHTDSNGVATAFICGTCDPSGFQAQKAREASQQEPECRFNCECHKPGHRSCNLNGGCDCPSLRNNGRLNDGTSTQVRNHFVSIWGSHPEAGNDDCWTGEHFRTFAEAEAAVQALLTGGLPKGWHAMYANDFAFVELDSTELAAPRVYENENYAKRRAQEDRLDRSEAQHLAAMSFGTQGWNDFEGC